MRPNIPKILLYAFLIGICPCGIAIAAALMTRDRIRRREPQNAEESCNM